MDISSLQNLLKKQSISKDDFKTGFKAVKEGGGYADESIFTSSYSDTEMDSLFSNFDVNGDGVIDKKDEIDGETLSDEVMSEDDLNLLVDEFNEMFSQTATTAASSASSAGGGSYDASSYGGNDQTSVQDSSNGEKDYSSMTADELSAELETAKNDLTTKQQTLNGIIDGSNSTLSTMQEGITTKEQEYQELLNSVAPDLAQQYQTAKDDLDTHKQTIADTTVKINEAQATVDSLTASIASLESQVQNYDSSISALEAKIGTEDAPADLSTRIAGLKSKRRIAADKKAAQETELTTAKEELETQQTTLSGLEAQTSQKEQTLQALEEQIAQIDNGELRQLETKIASLKTEYETQKTTLKSEAEEAVSTAQELVNKLQSEFDVKKTQEIKNEGTVNNAKGLYDSLGLEAQGLSFENFNFMFEGYQNLEDKGNGRITIVDEESHMCYVVDMNTKQFVGKYQVATGSGGKDDKSLDRGNKKGGNATPGGWLKVGDVHWGSKYKGNAMDLIGIEDCNSNTLGRSVIVHPIKYSIGYTTAGCLGFQESEDTIKNVIAQTGTRVFVIKKGMISSNSEYRRQSRYYQTATGSDYRVT